MCSKALQLISEMELNMKRAKCSLSAEAEQSAPFWHQLRKYTTFGSGNQLFCESVMVMAV